MSISKSQALEIIRLCSEGVSHPSIAARLDLPVVRVMQAVTKMRKAGLAIESPRDVRTRRNEEIRKAAEPYIAKVLQERKEAREEKRRKSQLIPAIPRPVNETPHERHVRIAKQYSAGVPVPTIAMWEGVTPPRVYAMLARHRRWGDSEAAATAKRIAREAERREKAEARAERERGKNAARDARARSKLGI